MESASSAHAHSIAGCARWGSRMKPAMPLPGGPQSKSHGSLPLTMHAEKRSPSGSLAANGSHGTHGWPGKLLTAVQKSNTCTSSPAPASSSTARPILYRELSSETVRRHGGERGDAGVIRGDCDGDGGDGGSGDGGGGGGGGMGEARTVGTRSALSERSGP